MERGASRGTRIEADLATASAGRGPSAITARILQVAGRAGYQAAVIDAVTGTVTAWPRFAWTVRAAAHGLSRRGLTDGDTAAVLVQDAASCAIAVNAIRATGATAVPIQPGLPLADVADQLNHSAARTIIATASLAGLAAEAADRSRVRQVYTFGEAAGATSLQALLRLGQQAADDQMAAVCGPGQQRAPAGWPDGLRSPDEEAGDAGLAGDTGGAGLSRRDVVVAAPPCGQGQAYVLRLDLALLAGATIVAAPVPLVLAASRVYRGTAAIVPAGTTVPGISPDRVFAVC